jgi:hypothetical protein
VLARLLLVLLFAAAALLAWLLLRDPLAALPRPDPEPRATIERQERRGDRSLSFVRLDTAELGPVRLVVDRPSPLPGERLPVLLVLGGLASGERNIGWITEIGDNAVIGYDWPITTAMPQGLDLLAALPELHRRTLAIPAQIATALGWLARQDWADPDRISLLGFSLGALAIPAAQRLAPAPIGWTVLAYGGAPIGALVAANPHLRPDWARPLLGAFADLALRPVEPSAHLPYLQGRFLVLEGSDDAFVPARTAARLRAATPEPKRVVRFEGGHMGVGPGQLELLARIIAESRAWLVAEGATNPN